MLHSAAELQRLLRYVSSLSDHLSLTLHSFSSIRGEFSSGNLSIYVEAIWGSLNGWIIQLDVMSMIWRLIVCGACHEFVAAKASLEVVESLPSCLVGECVMGLFDCVPRDGLTVYSSQISATLILEKSGPLRSASPHITSRHVTPRRAVIPSLLNGTWLSLASSWWMNGRIGRTAL